MSDERRRDRSRSERSGSGSGSGAESDSDKQKRKKKQDRKSEDHEPIREAPLGMPVDPEEYRRRKEDADNPDEDSNRDEQEDKSGH